MAEQVAGAQPATAAAADDATGAETTATTGPAGHEPAAVAAATAGAEPATAAAGSVTGAGTAVTPAAHEPTATAGAPAAATPPESETADPTPPPGGEKEVPDHPRDRARWAVPVAILLVALLAAVRARHFTLDDGAIDTRYIRNLVAGNGWVWNAGDHSHVNGVTSPAYVLVCAAVAAVIRNADLAQHLVSGVLAGVAGVAAWRLLRGAGAGPVAVGVGLLLPLLPALNRTWGLETAGYLALLLVGVQVRGRRAWVLAGLAPIVRPDGALLSVAVAVREVVRERRLPWRRVLLAAAVLAPWLLYSLWRFHELVPSTVAAKAAQGRYASGGFTYTAGIRSALLDWTGGSGAGADLLVAAAIGGLLVAAAGRRWAVLELAAVVGVQQLVFAAVPVPSYKWYYVPLLAVMLVLAGLLVGALPRVARLPAVPVAAAVCAVTLAVAGPSWLRIPVRNDPREASYAAISRLMAGQPRGSVVCSEVGTLGADLPLSRPVIDISGLTTWPTLSAGRYRNVFWTRPSRYFVFHWFTDRRYNPRATSIVDRLDPRLGPGTPFGSETGFVTDRRFARYRLLAVVHRAPYAALVVMVDPAVST